MLDLHSHSTFSPDSLICPEDLLRTAVARGIRYLAVTDHADFAPADTQVDLESYVATFQTLAPRFPELKLAIGIEIGIQKEHSPQITEYLSRMPLDLVIASMHRAADLDLANDSFTDRYPGQQAWPVFLEETLAAMEACPDFDVLGHFDILRRHGNVRACPFPDDGLGLLDEIFSWLVRHGKSLELNTSGFRYGLGSMHPETWMLERYRRAGGELVTMGSDAHREKNLGDCLREGLEILINAGFSAGCFYQGRKPVSLSLTDLLRGMDPTSS